MSPTQPDFSNAIYNNKTTLGKRWHDAKDMADLYGEPDPKPKALPDIHREEQKVEMLSIMSKSQSVGTVLRLSQSSISAQSRSQGSQLLAGSTV